MQVDDARELCILAHKGQYRRPKPLDSKLHKYSLEKYPSFSSLGYFIDEDDNKITYEAVRGWFIAEPYSNHPIAVAEMMYTDEEKIVAYLHDILEDTQLTYKDLHDKFGVGIAMNVLLLTKEHDKYEDYLGCLSKSNIARKVKLADMFHNMSTSSSPKQKAKYLKGIKILLKAL